MTEQEKERARRFGAYIRQLRVARGMTQQELATKCGYGHRATLGCNDVALYNFRHSYITNLATAGLPLICLKSLCGHTLDMPTLEIYGHTTENELRLAQTKLNEVFEALW